MCTPLLLTGADASLCPAQTKRHSGWLQPMLGSHGRISFIVNYNAKASDPGIVWLETVFLLDAKDESNIA